MHVHVHLGVYVHAHHTMYTHPGADAMDFVDEYNTVSSYTYITTAGHVDPLFSCTSSLQEVQIACTYGMLWDMFHVI